jgi:hypothetical protein
MHGSVTVVNTTQRKGVFDCLSCMEATVFSELTDTVGSIQGDTGDTIGTFTYPAGYQYRGAITSFTLASGKVQAYKSQD